MDLQIYHMDSWIQTCLLGFSPSLDLGRLGSGSGSLWWPRVLRDGLPAPENPWLFCPDLESATAPWNPGPGPTAKPGPCVRSLPPRRPLWACPESTARIVSEHVS